MTSHPLDPVVLIVDDNEKNLKLARDVLRAAGFRTLDAGSGAEAIALAGEHVPDLVLLDLRLPDMDGAEVAVRVLGVDVARFDAGNSHGQTDSEGSFKFDIRLPDFFAGRPLNRGAARVLVEATVKDAAGHSESRGEPVTVSAAVIDCVPAVFNVALKVFTPASPPVKV